MTTEATRVEALIAEVMAKYKGCGTLAQARYFEAVHQELAPLARELERENAALRALATDYAVFAGELSKGLHHDDPTWQEVYELGRRLREILMGSNDRVEGRDAASSRRVPSHDGLCGVVDTE